MNKFITWYKDDKLALLFSDTPHVCVRNILPSMTTLERQSVKKFPFLSKTQLDVIILDYKKNKKYRFTISKNYCWNGSDIPRIFWRIVGSRTEPQYLIASCLHDYMLENKKVIEYNRRLTTDIFKACLLEAGVNKFKANLMAEAVDLFQRLQNWSK